VFRMFIQHKGFKDEKLNEKEDHELDEYYAEVKGAEVEGAEVKGAEVKGAQVEGVEEKVETDNELPPTEEQIKKARNEILNVSRRDQADKEKAAASVESDWDVYSEYVVKHIHRIPSEGVEALAERLLIDKNVVEACAGKYFLQVVETCSLEVFRMFIQHKGFKDEKLNEKEDHEIDEYYDELERRLLMAMQVISWTKNESFREIGSRHHFDEATVRYLVHLFITFRKLVLEKASITTVSEVSTQEPPSNN
nr:hypothetical protein [Tanacetum cinerariifolium]